MNKLKKMTYKNKPTKRKEDPKRSSLLVQKN